METFFILNSLFFLYNTVLLFPVVLLFTGFNRQPLVYRWLAIAIGLALATDIISWVCWYVGINGSYSNQFYQLFVTALVSVFFYHAIEWRTLKGFFITVNVLYFSFSLTNVLYLQKSEINSYSQVLRAMIILLLCIIFFFKLLKELPTQQIHKLPLFWIVSSYFFSYSGKLVIYAITHYMISRGNDLMVTSIFHGFLSLIANLLIAVGVWINHRQTIPEPVK